MFKNYNNWFKNLPTLKDLMFSFILNWFFWLIMRLIADQLFFEEKHSWGNNMFHATWMSLFTMIRFNWKGIRHFFKPQKQISPNSDSDIP